ncbi:MAG TPA: hypothetical protein VF185_01875 [Patescibacteria group bacterium]
MSNTEFQPDADHSPYRALRKVVPFEGSWGKELIKKYPEHTYGEYFCVEGHSPLVSSQGVNWIPIGIMLMYPEVLAHLDKNKWVLAGSDEVTEEMKRIAQEITDSDFYKSTFLKSSQ